MDIQRGGWRKVDGTVSGTGQDSSSLLSQSPNMSSRELSCHDAVADLVAGGQPSKMKAFGAGSAEGSETGPCGGVTRQFKRKMK